MPKRRTYENTNINGKSKTSWEYSRAVQAFYAGVTRAIGQLTKYVDLLQRFLCGQISYLQSDSYLDRLHIWFEKSVLSGSFPREKRTVYDGMIAVLEAPVFELLNSEEAFAALQKRAEGIQFNDDFPLR